MQDKFVCTPTTKAFFNNLRLQKIIMSLFDKLNQAKGEKLAANLKAGEDFLEKNKQREGVQTTESGLQYEVLNEGNGPKPKATDKVKCHYHGTLIDGTIFDSSVQRGQPATFPLNMVIKGWTEALQLMSVGSKYRLFLHPGLAYGERQTGSVIGPNSTLIFDVELLGIG
ncbi:MAG TPA: FKBP-type peptidyl-prolyl cis-trans isomerase [Segetibacter sp.]|nr:FKBP-type peptidyl-prolyl cis-trans isomerase [Segetibacter sp.]